MGTTLEYERHQIPGGWDINNPNRKDGEGNQIYLAKEIETVLPGKHFKVICDDGHCNVNFQEDLTSEEESMVDTVVQNHQQNN